MTLNAEDMPTSLGVSIACDKSGFVRSECPRCCMEFKEEVEPDSLQDALSASVTNQINQEDSKSTSAWCPYCRHLGVQQDFIHAEISEYLKQVAYREAFQPLISKIFDGFGQGSARNTGLFSITVTASMDRSQRPLSGPEPDDQVIILCLSCKKRFKVVEFWHGSVCCPSCGIDLLPQ